MKPVVIRHFTVSADLAQPTKAESFVPSDPTVIPLGHKSRTFNTFHRTATTGTWRRHGSLYFERRGGLLFMAESRFGPYRRVPDWALLAVQWIPESIEDIQTRKSLYITEPGRQRNRKATEGEREIVAIVALKQFGKTWEEIGTILNIPRRQMEYRREEITRVFRDLEQIGNSEQVSLSNCQSLVDGWKGHDISGNASGKRTGAKKAEDDSTFTDGAAYSRAMDSAVDKAQRAVKVRDVREAVRTGELSKAAGRDEIANFDLSTTNESTDCTEILD